ncbi:MFS transporter [Streptomyces sp. NBC_00459]|uniref:MFS transporter n=1 Tax=Streptomyces sp. NBC_00459 TaxID=2975749 RepID=UPI002E18A382
MSEAAHGGATGLAGPAAPPRPRVGRITVLLLAAACGLCVANLYYLQPILPELAASLHRTPGSLTSSVSATQFGYALGLFALVPLGDAVDRRRLLTVLVTTAAAVLAVIPWADGEFLTGLFFLLGLVSVAAMVIVPQAAGMAPPERRGQVVGTVMTGVILGALLCRTFAGVVAELVDWRAVFWGAAALMLGVCVMLRRILPPQPAGTPLTARGYARLIGSLFSLVRARPVIMERCLYGALGFAAFTVLWTAVPLRLIQEPYHYGSAAIGAMGLLGAGGALGANLAGRFADRGRQRAVSACAFALIAVSFAVVSVLSSSLLVLGTAILLIDFAVQAAHISNQTTVFAQVGDEMRSRVTTVYMTCYFLGGAAGSALTGPLWAHGGWPDTALLGCAAGVCALLLLLGHAAVRRTVTSRKAMAATDD